MHVPLAALLGAVRARDAGARFYFVGDFVNRGSESRQVIELLISLGEGAQFVRGNHDDVFDQVLSGESYTGETSEIQRLAAFQWFMQHGLDQTFLSYGADMLDLEQVQRRPSLQSLQRLIDLVPQDHRQFMHDLPAVIEEPDLFIVHAKWDPDTAADSIASRAGSNAKTRYALLWGRFTADEIERKKRWRRRGFFGHTPVYNYADDDAVDDEVAPPIVRDDIVLLDTGAALGPLGRLTAICAETNDVVQTDRQARTYFTAGGK